MADQEKKTQKKKSPQLGKPPRLYRFFLNPYQDVRFSSCPQCANKTRQRKLPLFIHVSPAQPVTLNKTCRYCPNCDLLIAHQDEIEDILSRLLSSRSFRRWASFFSAPSRLMLSLVCASLAGIFSSGSTLQP